MHKIFENYYRDCLSEKVRQGIAQKKHEKEISTIK